MPAYMLYVNQNLNIVHRKGTFFAVHLCGTVPPTPLAEPDFCLLHACLAGADPARLAANVANGSLSRYFDGSPPEAHVRSRLQQLVQRQLLLEQTPEAAVADSDVARLASGSALAAVEPATSYRLSSHFALRPGHDGFHAWSSITDSWHTFDLDMLLLLCAFGQGKTLGDVSAEKAGMGNLATLAQSAQWLHEKGLLAPVVNVTAATPRTIETRGKTGEGDDWRSLVPDGRIPVYFTPHMENHFPLALGMMFSAIAAHDNGALLERFQLIPITYLEPRAFLEGPYQKFGPGLWLFSNYMWCLDINLQISAAAKNHNAGNLCIHGGPSTPGYKEACTEFMSTNTSVDIAVHGEGEITIVEILQCVTRSAEGSVHVDHDLLGQVHGLTFRTPTPGKLHWTPPRDRLSDLDVIPSPYLDGVFDDYQGRVEAAIIESNRGCPFGCTFCDWGSATRQKVRKFDLERVAGEIEWIGRNRTQVLWIADANYGLYDRDVELAQIIVDTKARHGFPREVVVNYTKNTNRRLIEIIRIFSAGGIISQGIISIQTTDESTLEVINRKNIKTDKYDELAEVFSEANLPLSTDLMIGLPGITVDAWDRDLQRYFDADVSVKAYPTQLLPNSPMADPEYREKYQIEVDENDFVVSCHSFDRQQLEQMKAIYYLFEIADGFGLMRYVLRYLQWDHGLPALSVLQRLLRVSRHQPQRYPLLTWVNRFFLTEKNVPGGWRNYYEQLRQFILAEFSIADSPALETALRVNEAVMPDDVLTYPRSVQLTYDFGGYFQAQRKNPEDASPLESWQPAGFEVDDPDLMAHIDMDYMQYDSHQYFYELRSAIARPKSVSDVRERTRDAA